MVELDDVTFSDVICALFLIVFVVCGVWKLVEIICYICSHVQINFV